MSQEGYINTTPTLTDGENTTRQLEQTADDYLKPTEDRVPSEYLTMQGRPLPDIDNGCYEEIEDNNVPGVTRTGSLPHRYLQVTEDMRGPGYRGNKYEDTTFHGVSVVPQRDMQPTTDHKVGDRKWKVICVLTAILSLLIIIVLVGLLIYFYFTWSSIPVGDAQYVCPEVPCFDNKYCSSVQPSDEIYIGCPCTLAFLDSNCSLRKFGPFGASDRYLSFSHKGSFEKHGPVAHIEAWDYKHNHLLGLKFGYSDNSATETLGVPGERADDSQAPKTLTLWDNEHITKVCTWSGKYPLEINYYVIRKIEFMTDRGRRLTAGGVNTGEEVDKQCTPDNVGYLAYVEGKSASTVDSLDFIFSRS